MYNKSSNDKNVSRKSFDMFYDSSDGAPRLVAIGKGFFLDLPHKKARVETQALDLLTPL